MGYLDEHPEEKVRRLAKKTRAKDMNLVYILYLFLMVCSIISTVLLFSDR